MTPSLRWNFANTFFQVTTFSILLTSLSMLAANAEEPVILNPQKTYQQIKDCLLVKNIDVETQLELQTTPDPLESVNRTIFDFNETALVIMVRKVGAVYEFVVPELGREMISDAFRNVETPGRVINDLLQAKFADAAIEVLRFLVNSTAGIGGLFDVAKMMGFRAPPAETLGQTLGHYGVGPGLYMVVPLSGGTNIRDFLASLGEGLIDPISLLPKLSTETQVFLSTNEMMVNNTGRRALRMLEITPDPYYQQKTIDDLLSTALACE